MFSFSFFNVYAKTCERFDIGNKLFMLYNTYNALAGVEFIEKNQIFSLLENLAQETKGNRCLSFQTRTLLTIYVN